MNPLHWINIAVTALLFMGVVNRMLRTPELPRECWKCQFQFGLWVAAHIVVAVVVGLIFMDNISGPMKEVTHRYLALKAALAVLFLYPWKTKVVGL